MVLAVMRAVMLFRIRTIAKTSTASLLVLLMWQAALAQGHLNVRLTVQEALYAGAPTRGITRHQGPVTVGVPLADSAAVRSVSQLGLTGASSGQFRVLGRWPSGNIQWVLVDTQANVPAGGRNTGIALSEGHGNFGGPDLARDGGAAITVNTGPAQFVIRKAKFNLFDQVAVNGKTLVAHGSSSGLVLLGPSSGTSCGPCTDPYTSANDPSSTAMIEENGPVRAVVKATGSHVDAAGRAYMHYTVRMYFYRGKTDSKVEVILRNADEPHARAGDFNSAFKGFTSYEARLDLALGGGRSFKIGKGNGVAAGRFTGDESAYIYQGYSNNMEVEEWNSRNCTKPGNSRCVASYVARSAAPKGGGYLYTQDGYQVVHGSSLLDQGDHTRYPQGWADLSDGSGAGVEVGVYQFAAYWPKSLQFVNGGSEVRVGIWPNQSLFNRGGGQPYYQAWPSYSIHDLYFNFHDTAPASPANDFLSFQHYLVARAQPFQYNQAGVFLYPLPDVAAEDKYYRSISVTCCLEDKTPRIFRFYDWPGGGAGNQHELRWSYLRNFLQRGLTGRYLFAAHFYRMIAEQSFPRSDGFDWRNHPLSELNYTGLPTEIASADGALATRNWTDAEHPHWYGMTDYYFMTGDETIKDQILDGVKDRFLNSQIKIANGKLPDSRDLGVYLMGIAHLYSFLEAISDADAAKLIPIADRSLALQVFPELNLSGFGDEKPPIVGLAGSQGISRTRGVQYGCCNSDSWGNLSGRVGAPFRQAILAQGMWELAQAFGPRWPNYNLTTDLAYGISQWCLTEGYGSPPRQKPNAMNSGFIYTIFLDLPNNTSKFYLQPGDGQTNWYSFYLTAAYVGDLSWRRKFEWLMQRISQSHSQSIFAEYGSNLIQAVVDEIIDPPALELITVPLKVTDSGPGTYRLVWTVPPGARSYRIKYYPGKTIVDWIGFDPGANKFRGDPHTTWPWFAANDAGDVPSPASPGSTQTYVFKGEPSQNYHFALKAYVERQTAKRR